MVCVKIKVELIYMAYYGRGKHEVRKPGDFAGYKSSIVNRISISTTW